MVAYFCCWLVDRCAAGYGWPGAGAEISDDEGNRLRRIVRGAAGRCNHAYDERLRRILDAGKVA